MAAKPEVFHQWIELQQPRLGTRVTYATDEFFGAKERLIDSTAPVFIDDKYDEHGKWMDGWESRRKRTPGNDYCIIRLGVPGVVHGVDIDTSYFTGNYPPEASLDACTSNIDVPAGDWIEVLGKTPLTGNSHHYLAIDSGSIWSHLRLNIFPDGGIARLRVFGEVRLDPATVSGLIDLFALENGGRALACSDEHYGSMHNLNVAGRGVNMGDGWETARRRGPGNDWAILALGHPGAIERVEIDTAHFKGNYPDRASLEAALFAADDAVAAESAQWRTLLPESKLQMDHRHEFDAELVELGPVSHVRLSIYPDGGVSRLRLYGHLQRDGEAL